MAHRVSKEFLHKVTYPSHRLCGFWTAYIRHAIGRHGSRTQDELLTNPNLTYGPYGGHGLTVRLAESWNAQFRESTPSFPSPDLPNCYMDWAQILGEVEASLGDVIPKIS
jgi:hypothetical protein